MKFEVENVEKRSSVVAFLFLWRNWVALIQPRSQPRERSWELERGKVNCWTVYALTLHQALEIEKV